MNLGTRILKLEENPPSARVRYVWLNAGDDPKQAQARDIKAGRLNRTDNVVLVSWLDAA